LRSGDRETHASYETAPNELVAHASVGPACWNPSLFADEQIQRLVQRVFFPGLPKPARQVVFAGLEGDRETAYICAEVARQMAAQLPGSVCAVDCDVSGHSLGALLGHTSGPEFEGNSIQSARPPETNSNLWLVPSASFLEADNGEISALKLQSRMGDLRRKFDYVMVRVPGGEASLPTLLGQFADGVILVVHAQLTRRSVALRMKERLQAVNARLLGVVLAGRRFPIPERIYRWL